MKNFLKQNDRLDIHTHTTASGHAYNTLYEMVRAAADQGLTLFGSSDHGPALPGSCHEMYFCNFKVIPHELFGVKLIMGCELNILDYQGTVDLPEYLLNRIDYAIASIHDHCYRIGTIEENTAATVNAMKNPRVHIIGHPDNSRIPLNYEILVSQAKEHHVPHAPVPGQTMKRCSLSAAGIMFPLSSAVMRTVPAMPEITNMPTHFWQSWTFRRNWWSTQI